MELEKNVPVPKRKYTFRNPVPHKYPFATMEVGDSFFAPVTEELDVTTLRSRLSSIYGHYAVEGKKFTLRTTENGVRVWRVK